MEQNKELRKLVESMLKTYDEVNTQTALEIAAGTQVNPRSIEGRTAEEILECFTTIGEGNFADERGFREEFNETYFLNNAASVMSRFLDTFSDDNLLELIEEITDYFEDNRKRTKTRFEDALVELHSKKTA